MKIIYTSYNIKSHEITTTKCSNTATHDQTVKEDNNITHPPLTPNIKTWLDAERDMSMMLGIIGVKYVVIDDLIVTRGINKIEFIVELSKE